LLAAQLLIGSLQATVALASVLLLAQLLLKILRSDSDWFHKRRFAALNLAFSSAPSYVLQQGLPHVAAHQH